MVEPKDLSNQELVDEYHKCRNVAWTEEEHNRRWLLREEMLRRLNEIKRLEKVELEYRKKQMRE